MGIDVASLLMTKQLSISGSSDPRVNALFGLILLYTSGPPVGIPLSSTGRYKLVLSLISVPVMVGAPERLKYLIPINTGPFSTWVESCDWQTYE